MTEFERFLDEFLPSLGLSPAACRRKALRRRIRKRMESQGIHEFSAYLSHLRNTPHEREALRPLLTVTISRFFRNRRVFDTLSRRVLLPLAEKGIPSSAWSAGAASGEEAFTLRILWEELPDPKPRLAILATDVDEACLGRAEEGLYEKSSLREVPRPAADRFFRKEGERYRLREDVVRSVTFRRHDLLRDPVPGVFDLVLCRNTAFTYFDAPRRISVAGAIASSLSPGGHLVIGRTETLPPEAAEWFGPFCRRDNIYRRL